MVTLYYGYQARRRRERKFWILVLYRDENRAVGARKFWIQNPTKGENRAVGARFFWIQDPTKMKIAPQAREYFDSAPHEMKL